MSFIPIDSNHFVNTKNIDHISQEIIDGETIIFVTTGGDKLRVAEGNVDTVLSVMHNLDKEEGNWAGR
jgi:hypothetical protein